MKSYRKTFRNLSLLLLPLASTLAGCTRDHQFQPVDMWNQSRLKPYEEVNIPGGTTALPIPEGVIARGQLRDNDALYRGKANGQLVTAFPFAITPEVLKRGQQRYTIYCAPCHGAMGDGKGIIVQRGFATPPDYTIPRLVDAPVGHFYDVITNGYGAMYSYAARVPVDDRWAISAYIRVLQKARAKAKDNKGVVNGPTIPGGGVYSPGLDPSEPATGKEEGGHEGGGQETAGHQVGNSDAGHVEDASNLHEPSSGAGGNTATH